MRVLDKRNVTYPPSLRRGYVTFRLSKIRVNLIFGQSLSKLENHAPLGVKQNVRHAVILRECFFKRFVCTRSPLENGKQQEKAIFIVIKSFLFKAGPN